MELGTPELFFDDLNIRLNSIKMTISEYEQLANVYRKQFEGKVDQFTKLYIKGLGNEIAFHKLFRDLFFNSRELLDFVLIVLEKNFGTNRTFTKFSGKLMNGDYDSLNIEITRFLQNNFTYVYQIRKVRNEIKNKPSNIKFRFVTDHFESYFSVPILAKEDNNILKFLKINNKDEAITKGRYFCIYNLDELFPEILSFWITCLSILKNDVIDKYASKTVN